MLKKLKLIKKIVFWALLISLIFVFVHSPWWLVLALPLLAIYIMYCIAFHHLQKFSSKGARIQVWEGGPRVGKTDSATTIATVLARKQYAKCLRTVKRKYWFYKRILNMVNKYQFVSESQQSKLYEFLESQKTVSFYKKHPEYIPCLVSNVTILDNNQKSMALDYEMFTQEKYMPFRCVTMITEGASIFPIDSYKERGKNEELALIANFFERVGHYIDGYIIMDNQDADNMSKDIKRLSPAIMKIHHSLPKFFKLLGLRAFKAKETERVMDGETVVRTDEDDGYHFLLLPCAIGKYNDRHLRKLYPSKNEIIEASELQDLIIDDTLHNRELYSRTITKKK